MSASPYEQMMAIADVVRRVGQMPELVAERAAPKIADLLEQQAESGTDPYGVPWAPLRDGTRSYLYDSGAMREGTDAVSAGTQIIASSPTPAEFHQGGTRRMPARPVLPNDGSGLPLSWELAIEQAERELEAEIQAQIDAA